MFGLFTRTGEHVVKDLGGSMIDLGGLALNKIKENKAKNCIKEHIEQGFLIIEENQFSEKTYDVIKKVKTEEKFNSKEAAILYLIEQTKKCGGDTLVLTDTIVIDNSKIKTIKEGNFTRDRQIIDINARAIGIAAKRKDENGLLTQQKIDYHKKETQVLAQIKEQKEMLESGLIDESEYKLREARIKESLLRAKEEINKEILKYEEKRREKFLLQEKENLIKEEIRKAFEGDDYIKLKDFKNYKYSSLVKFLKDKYTSKGFKILNEFDSKDKSKLYLVYKDSEIALRRDKDMIQLIFVNLKANIYTDKIENFDKSILINENLKWENNPKDETLLTYKLDNTDFVYIISDKPFVKIIDKELLFNFSKGNRRIKYGDIKSISVVDDKKGLFLKKPAYKIILTINGDLSDNVLLENKDEAYRIVNEIKELIKKK